MLGVRPAIEVPVIGCIIERVELRAQEGPEDTWLILIWGWNVIEVVDVLVQRGGVGA